MLVRNLYPNFFNLSCCHYTRTLYALYMSAYFDMCIHLSASILRLYASHIQTNVLNMQNLSTAA
jgi:hypothetical protein